jgi:hypothetical protein
VDRGTKECHIDDWDKLSPEELERMITDEDDVGIRLDNLSVLDFERPELVEAVFTEGGDVLSQHTWVAKTGRGYHIYMRGLPSGKKFEKADGLVEFRSSADFYVVAPPSLHPSGARYEWVTDIEKVGIAEASPQGLERMRHRVEVLRLFGPFIKGLEKAWTESHRHYLALWLSGVLYKLGYEREDAELVLKAVARLAHDSEVGDRVRALHDTYRKERSEVGGWSKLRAELEGIVGPERTAEIIRLLPRREAYFEVKPLSQLVTEAKPIEWIVENLIPRYGLVILAGKAGVGKSFLSLHLAHAVANGENLLGIVPIRRRGKVLIVDNENYPGLYLQRVAALGLNPLDGIDVLSLSGFRLDSARCIEWLEKTLMDQKYSMVILDSWSDLTSRIDENKAGEVGRVLSRLRRLSYENDCCFVLIHHLRKNLPFAVEQKDELRGSSVLVNEADIVLLLQNLKDSKILKTIKQRYGEEQAFEVQFDNSEEKLTIRARPIGVDETQNEVLKALEAIIEYLETKGNPATRQEILENLPFSEPTVKRALSIGINLGRILRVGRGIYTLPQRLEQFNA